MFESISLGHVQISDNAPQLPSFPKAQWTVEHIATLSKRSGGMPPSILGVHHGNSSPARDASFAGPRMLGSGLSVVSAWLGAQTYIYIRPRNSGTRASPMLG